MMVDANAIPTVLTAPVVAAGVRHLRCTDARLAAVIDHVGACTLRPGKQVYRSLFRAILYQQLIGKAAAAIERRLYLLFGGHIPPPCDFLRAGDAPLLSAGLSGRKLSYLRDLATAFDTGRLRPQRLVRMADEEVIAAVTTVCGIGEWTAHMLLIFSLGRRDILPVGDYGVRKGIQRLYGLRQLPAPPMMERLAGPWRPYRSIAAWYIWRSMD